MSQRRKTIKGNQESSTVALLLIDLINDLEFEGGEKLAANILPLIKNIVRLKKKARSAGVPVIYVNDNFGKWRSDFKKLLSHCLRDDVKGRPLAQQLLPQDDDYFVLKPKHSGFYSSTLDLLLSSLGTRTLILAGLTGDICVLFTASDAHMRDYQLVIASDCVASEDSKLNKAALKIMKTRLDAQIKSSRTLDMSALRKQRKRVAHTRKE